MREGRERSEGEKTVQVLCKRPRDLFGSSLVGLQQTVIHSFLPFICLFIHSFTSFLVPPPPLFYLSSCYFGRGMGQNIDVGLWWSWQVWFRRSWFAHPSRMGLLKGLQSLCKFSSKRPNLSLKKGRIRLCCSNKGGWHRAGFGTEPKFAWDSFEQLFIPSSLPYPHFTDIGEVQRILRPRWRGLRCGSSLTADAYFQTLIGRVSSVKSCWWMQTERLSIHVFCCRCVDVQC